MSASTISRRRSSAQAEARAAKEKKQKIFLAIGLVLLVLLLVLELPKLMKSSGGSASSPTSPPATVEPTAVGAVASPANSPAVIKHDVAVIRRMSSHDLFARSNAVGVQPAFQEIRGPSGVRDPFGGTGTATSAPVIPTTPSVSSSPAPLPAQIVIGKKSKNAVATRGWIVILASIPTHEGRSSASSFVANAAKKGVTGLSVLNSSNSRPLRGGYWVVYTGPFSTIASVNQHANSVHQSGFGSAYVRQLVVYHAK